MEYKKKMGFPHSSVGKNICLQCRRPGYNPWVGNIPWHRKWQPTPVFLPGESHGQKTWKVIVHGIARVRHNSATKPPPQKMGNNIHNL